MSRTYRKIDPTMGTRDTTRDKKKKYKPDSKFKKSKSRREKAQLKEALIQEREDPKLKKTNVWDWD